VTTYLICPSCRQQYRHGTTCPCKPPKRGAGKARAAQQRARTRALAASDGQCVAIVDGIRCTATTHLHAAHVRPYAQTAAYDDVVTLCSTHHLEYDRQQRQPRPLRSLDSR
jgi:hypothetical protein